MMINVSDEYFIEMEYLVSIIIRGNIRILAMTASSTNKRARAITPSMNIKLNYPSIDLSSHHNIIINQLFIAAGKIICPSKYRIRTILFSRPGYHDQINYANFIIQHLLNTISSKILYLVYFI